MERDAAGAAAGGADGAGASGSGAGAGGDAAAAGGYNMEDMVFAADEEVGAFSIVYIHCPCE